MKRLLKTAAPPYLYSGPSPVASLATTLAGLEVNDRRGDALRADLWAKTKRVLDALDRLGVHTPNRSGFPIIEVPLARHEHIDDVGSFLFENGIYVTLAAYPLVPRTRSASASSSPQPTRRGGRPAHRRARPARQPFDLQPARAKRGRRDRPVRLLRAGTRRGPGTSACRCRARRPLPLRAAVQGLRAARRTRSASRAWSRSRPECGCTAREARARVVAASPPDSSSTSRRLLHLHLPDSGRTSASPRPATRSTSPSTRRSSPA